jgi:hypothetical protein
MQLIATLRPTSSRCPPLKARPSHQMIIDKAVIGHSAFRGERWRPSPLSPRTAHQSAARSPRARGRRRGLRSVDDSAGWRAVDQVDVLAVAFDPTFDERAQRKYLTARAAHVIQGRPG